MSSSSPIWDSDFFILLEPEDLFELKLLKSFFGDPQKQALGGEGDNEHDLRERTDGDDATNVLEVFLGGLEFEFPRGEDAADVLHPLLMGLEFESLGDSGEDDGLFPGNLASADSDRRL